MAGKRIKNNGAEVDFIIHSPFTVPLESKATLKVNNRHFTSIKKYLAASGLKVGILVSAASFQRIEEGDYTLFNLPVYLCNMANIEFLINETK